ncbi:MAG: hypothetical protein K9G11_03015 [Rickettsiaceae bacterium]|nr:hypothetical protein [Rickettsiaceae bacterium]
MKATGDKNENLDKPYTVTQELPPQDNIIKAIYQNYPDLFEDKKAKKFVDDYKSFNLVQMEVTEKLSAIKNQHNLPDINSDKSVYLEKIERFLLLNRKPNNLASDYTNILELEKEIIPFVGGDLQNKLPPNLKKSSDFPKALQNLENSINNHQKKLFTRAEQIPEVISPMGMCFGLTSLWLWNKRQENIGNTTKEGNPTGIMTDVFNKITNIQNPNEVTKKDVALLTNYILATQNSNHIAKELDLVGVADKKDQKYLKSEEENRDRIMQGFYLVDPSDNIEKPMIQKVVNKDNRVERSLENLDYILQPGVLFGLNTKNHAMGCYMDEKKNIFFYDPNDGKEVTFKEVDELKKYLTSDNKMVANYFPEGKFIPEVFIVNSGTAKQEQIKAYYANLDKLLNKDALKIPLQNNSSKIKDVCIQELQESRILYSIKNNKTIEDKDPVIFAIDKGVKIEGKDPITYAIDKGVKIEGKDPITYALDNGVKIEGNSALVANDEKKTTTGVKKEAQTIGKSIKNFFMKRIEPNKDIDKKPQIQQVDKNLRLR